MRIKLRRYAELILAADKYVSQELPRAKLTPWEVERLNLLSSDWSGGPAPSSPNVSPNWQDDLWLGRWGSDGIGVGITGCRWVLAPVIQKFAPYARATFFPYPFRYRNARQANQDFGQLLMVFSRSALHGAAHVAKFVVPTSQ